MSEPCQKIYVKAALITFRGRLIHPVNNSSAQRMKFILIEFMRASLSIVSFRYIAFLRNFAVLKLT